MILNRIISQIDEDRISRLGVCIIFVVLFMATNICRAENLGKLVVEREVLMRESEVLGDPFAVAKTDDGGFVLAGSTGIKSAGATKIDGQGKPLWNYTTPAQYPVKFLPRPPQYHAI